MFEPHASPTRNVKNDVLSGLTVALALVPEAVAFAFVAGVDPLVGLYAAFLVGLITASIGGRPGMISGATGALAVVMVALVAEHGVEYLFATVVLMGIIQISAGLLRLGKFIRMVPHPVMLGFVNGLAIVIFLAQLIPTTHSANSDITILNSEMPGIAARKSTVQSPIIIVDQNTGYDPAADNYDGLHPNEAGEEKMAQNWFEAFDEHFTFTIPAMNMIFICVLAVMLGLSFLLYPGCRVGDQ